MNPERWLDIIGNIKDNFKVEEEDREHYEEEGGVDIDYIIFNGPLGRMRIEFVAKPIVLDKKTTYSNRAGAETIIDYIYSKTEKSYKLTAYKWNTSEEEWIEIDASNFA